jgi:LmbE family N-acetylglucosaminyl deacetylase
MVQIISPHIDDAFLSLGGNMLNWVEANSKIIVFNIFSKSDYTSPKAIWNRQLEFDKIIISQIRQEEERRVSRRVGFDFQCWDYPDWPLRQNSRAEDEESMIQQIASELHSKIDQRFPIYFPLGIAHPDHTIINTLSEMFIKQGPQLFFYEDMPHLSWGNYQYSEIFTKNSVNKIPIVKKIDFEKKSEILRIYESQLEESWLKSMMSYSYNITDNCFYERYWKLLQ